jgi:hypothetical protein
VTVAALGAPTGSGLTFVKEPKQQLMWFGDTTKRKRRYQVSIKRYSEKGAERDFAQQVTNSAAGQGRRLTIRAPYSRAMRAAISERWQAAASRSTQKSATLERPTKRTSGSRSAGSRISSV